MSDTIIEEWRQIAGSPDGYEISNLGRVRKITYLALPAAKKKLGGGRYPRVHVGVQQPRKIHQLVAEAFLGPRPDGMTIDHINGDRDDNRAANLEYVTVQENIRRAIESGAIPCKRRHWREVRKMRVPFKTKLTLDMAREIKKLLGDPNQTRVAIAKQFGVSGETIRRIAIGELWRDA